jgi:hypothetical protein
LHDRAGRAHASLDPAHGPANALQDEWRHAWLRLVDGFQRIQHRLLEIRLLTGDPGSTFSCDPTFLELHLLASERQVLAGGVIELGLLPVEVSHQVVDSVAQAAGRNDLTPGLGPCNGAFLLLLAGCCLLLHQPGVEGGDVVGVGVVGHQAIDTHQLFLLIGPHLLKVPSRAGLHLLELEALLGLGIGKRHLLLCRLGTSHRLTDAKASTDDAHGDWRLVHTWP